MSTELATRPAKADIITRLGSESVRTEMAAVVPPGVDINLLMARAKTAIISNPDLLQCTPQSVLLAVKKSIGCGLDLNGRDCHLVPYNKKDKATGGWVKEAQFQIDFKGYIALGMRCGMRVITSDLVCKNDTFRIWTDDTGRHLLHEINHREPRGEVLGAYSYTENATGAHDYEYMRLEEIEGIKRRSKGKESGPWVTDENEMRRKTVIRRHSKRWDIDTRFKRAIEDDDDRLDALPEVKRAPMILPGDPAPAAETPALTEDAAPYLEGGDE